MVTVSVKPPGKPAFDLELAGKKAEQVTVAQLKASIHQKFPKIPVIRQRLTIPSSDPQAKPTVLAEDTHDLARYGVQDGATRTEIRLKDLGPQIAWRTVFLAEYFGPIVIQPAIYYLSIKGHTIWGGLSKLGLWMSGSASPYIPSVLQKTVLACIVLHYIKRELETIFVHKFSHATMPMFNIFKNCSHYWFLCGFMTAVSLFRARNGAAALEGTLFNNPTWITFWAIVWAYAELSNLATHLNLRSIRTPPGQPRKFPKGYGFDSITCANYWFESLGWIALTIMTCDPSFLIFTAVSMGQMMEWAVKKHKAYRKEHGAKYPKRNKMIPFLF